MENHAGEASVSDLQYSMSFSSNSAESLEFHGEERRESSVGPILEQTSYMKIRSRCKQNKSYGSLPTSGSHERVWSFSSKAHSTPTTPTESLEREHQLFRRRQLTSSSSVSEEEATESVLKKARSRLSLNLGIFDAGSSNASSARSPRFLPKILRSSLSKLTLKSKSYDTSQEYSEHNVNTERRIISDDDDDDITDDLEKKSPSLTTKLFVQESLAKGLPIIPFNYSPLEFIKSDSRCDCDAQDDKRQKAYEYSADRRGSRSEPSIRRDTHKVKRDAMKLSLEEKSLKKLLGDAKRELEEEADHKKSSPIRGYAANNSRAHLRRKSSVSGYVKMSRKIDREKSEELNETGEAIMKMGPSISREVAEDDYMKMASSVSSIISV